MRKILFRAKIKDERRAKELNLKVGDWVYGYYFNDKGLEFINGASKRFDRHYIINTPCFEEFIEISPETLGQYTGIKDKNGVQIFEGDTVKINAHNYDYGFKQEEIGQIKFIDGSFGFYRKIDNIKYCFYDLPTEVAEREIDYYEVIG